MNTDMKAMLPDDLQPHPEGGRFQEVFRSKITVECSKIGERSALTHIYFELKEGERSRLHRVSSEEVWNLYEGELRLWLYDGKKFEAIELSAKNRTFCYVVPCGVWQAAEPIGATALVGCSVGPGFEFEDFAMLKNCPEKEVFLNQYPEKKAWV